MSFDAVQAVDPAVIPENGLVFVDYPAWHSLLLFITVIAALIVFVLKMRRLWRSRQHIHQHMHPPEVFALLAILIASLGLLDFLLSLATFCDHYTLASGSEARQGLFLTNLSGRLRILAVCLGSAAFMYLTPSVLFWSLKRRTPEGGAGTGE